MRDKNLRRVGGKPLVLWTLEAAVASEAFERILVSSDSEAIREISSAAGIPPLPPRESHLSHDTATSHSVVSSILENEKAEGQQLPDAVCLLQPTSPFRTAQHIRAAIELFSGRPDADCMVSCQEVASQWLPPYQGSIDEDGFLVSTDGKPVAYPSHRPPSPNLVRNGAIYLTRLPQIHQYLVGGRILPYVMDDLASIDINSEFDLLVADLLASSAKLLRT